MNAVNWLKRRVSLSSSSSPPLQTSSQQQSTPTGSSSNNNITNAPLATSRPSSVRGSSSTHNTRPIFMQQHDIIDPSSPLSILAATSKLTTFPYGELQALNARRTLESARLNGNINTVNGLNVVNGIPPPVANTKENTLSVTQPVAKPKTRLKERNNQTLLPSAMPLPLQQIPNGASITVEPSPFLQPPSFPFSRPIAKQRNASTPALQNQRPRVSHSRASSLSSTQNTRSSKRLKTSHPTSAPPPLTTPAPKPIIAPNPSKAAKSVPSAPPAKGKRVLPVRQGHIDILDGEISLLSTPQRLDNRPSFEPSHKVILVDDSIPSTPTTRYEPFNVNTIPDPNTSPSVIRPRSIAAAQIVTRHLPRLSPPEDPLPNSLYVKPHRRHEITEIRLRNREREKIDYEASLLDRQLTILRSEDWRKIVAPAAAERDGLKDGEEWDWEGRRERRITLLENVLKRVRTWREAEIKIRRGILKAETPEVEERVVKRKRKVEEMVEVGESIKVKHRRVPSTMNAGEMVEETVDDLGNRRSGRRKGTAFGEVIPKIGLICRDFQIPLEWVPEEKRG